LECGSSLPLSERSRQALQQGGFAANPAKRLDRALDWQMFLTSWQTKNPSQLKTGQTLTHFIPPGRQLEIHSRRKEVMSRPRETMKEHDRSVWVISQVQFPRVTRFTETTNLYS
jgi:hypothetical protein